MIRDYTIIMKQVYSAAEQFGYKMYTNKGVYKLELPDYLLITFEKNKVTLNNKGKIYELNPYDISVSTAELDLDIRRSPFEPALKGRKARFKITFYMGRTVGVPMGIIYALEVNPKTNKVMQDIGPNGTNVYNVSNKVLGRTYEDILGWNKQAKNISTSDYRKMFKINLGYFDKNIDELIRAMKKLLEYMPDYLIPTGYEKAKFPVVKQYLEDNSELCKCNDYYLLRLFGGRRIYFKVNEECYTVFKVNQLMLREYAEDKNGLMNIRVLKDKYNTCTQYITLFEYNKFEIIFNFLNNRYYIKLNNFLLDCTETFAEAVNRLNRMDGLAEPDKKYFEIRNKIYGM